MLSSVGTQKEGGRKELTSSSTSPSPISVTISIVISSPSSHTENDPSALSSIPIPGEERSATLCLFSGDWDGVPFLEGVPFIFLTGVSVAIAVNLFLGLGEVRLIDGDVTEAAFECEGERPEIEGESIDMLRRGGVRDITRARGGVSIAGVAAVAILEADLEGESEKRDVVRALRMDPAADRDACFAFSIDTGGLTFLVTGGEMAIGKPWL